MIKTVMRLNAIHESLVNGQRKQMVEQIDIYGVYDFWKDYTNYLAELYYSKSVVYDYFSDAVISYFRIKGR
jgi:predicted transcriptional regulator YheO